jgi:hypothetical protein
MGLTLDGCTFISCGTAVRAPSTMDIVAKNTEIQDCQKGFDLFDPEVMRKLDIPGDVNPEDIRAVIAELKKHPNATDQEMTETVAKSKLGTVLGATERVTKVAASLIAIVKTGVSLWPDA